MTIMAVLFVNAKGEVVISRTYRDGFSRAVADTFRSQARARKRERSAWRAHSHCKLLAARRAAAAPATRPRQPPQPACTHRVCATSFGRFHKPSVPPLPPLLL